MTKILFALTLALFSLRAAAEIPPDAPDQGESFAHFFARITNGNNKYLGISFDAATPFQNLFLPRFKENAWVGDQNAIERTLGDQGVNLWFDWFKTDEPLHLAVPGAQPLAQFERDLDATRASECPACRPAATLASTAWSQWTVPERAVFAKTYVLHSRIFGGRRILDFVAENFGFDPDLALAALSVQILPHPEFVTAVRKLGWNGDVYFRGITAPIPGGNGKITILLDGDFLRDKTENSAPLFQMLEYAGILTHELNHVFQDLDSARLGLDLSISSPEGILLIEGQAECLAEQAMTRAGGTLATNPSALSLYVTQQAIGLMDKDAGANYEFFPYKVGLPFVYSLTHLKTALTPAEVRLGVYRTILGQKSLTSLVSDL